MGAPNPNEPMWEVYRQRDQAYARADWEIAMRKAVEEDNAVLRERVAALEARVRELEGDDE